MILTLYKTDDADNVINKVLTNATPVTIRLKASTDVVSPSLLLAGGVGLDLQQFNYCHIDALNRYYFIQDIDAVNNRMFRLQCVCDVVETYKADIFTSNARFMRNIQTGDYLDATLQKEINSSATIYESDVGFTGTPTMVLTTVGKKGN